MRTSRLLLIASLAGTAFYSGAAFAQEGSSAPGIRAEDVVGPSAAAPVAPEALPPQPGQVRHAYSEDERQGWLSECRRRYGDNGLGGAVIGGVIGGIAGNQLAGRGNRTVGTIAGAAVGAVAGAAIDKAEDKDRVRDSCEAYLAQYEAGYGAYASGGYGSYPAAYAYWPAVWVPVPGGNCGCDCKPKTREIVTEEWVDEKPARRAIPKPHKPTKLQPIKPAPTKSKLTPIK